MYLKWYELTKEDKMHKCAVYSLIKSSFIPPISINLDLVVSTDQLVASQVNA